MSAMADELPPKMHELSASHRMVAIPIAVTIFSLKLRCFLIGSFGVSSASIVAAVVFVAVITIVR